jgi:hypothetical protein
MLQFDKLRKQDLLREDSIAALVKAEKDNGRNPDGSFKLGPVNAQHKNGDQAFQMAQGHLNSAQEAAKIGDAHAAAFHIGMAQQYANAGCQNHMLGSYLKDTQGKPVMMPAPDMGQGGGQRGGSGGQRGRGGAYGGGY